jgi:cytochrome c biogenesis protein CcmG/thiol:disulfide interchange protein DsbE
VTQIFDPEGRLGIDLGVAGAPETFLVDSKGIIQLRIQGEVNDRVFLGEIQPLLETLQ